MLALDFPRKSAGPLKILCLGAHSDDIEIGCGGTILRLLANQQEIDIVWVVFGAGNKREQEARASANLFLSQAIAIVRQEFFFFLQVLFNGFEALADIRIYPGIRESNPPIMDIAIQQIHLFATARKNKIVGSALVVSEKVIFHSFRPMSQTENEVLVAEVGVVLHHMPEDRPIANEDHRFGSIFRVADA